VPSWPLYSGRPTGRLCVHCALTSLQLGLWNLAQAIMWLSGLAEKVSRSKVKVTARLNAIFRLKELTIKLISLQPAVRCPSLRSSTLVSRDARNIDGRGYVFKMIGSKVKRTETFAGGRIQIDGSASMTSCSCLH